MDELRIERKIVNESVDEGKIGDVVDDEGEEGVEKRGVDPDG